MYHFEGKGGDLPRLGEFNVMKEWRDSELRHSMDFELFFRKVDQQMGMNGAGVVYIDAKGVVRVLREFKTHCLGDPMFIVLREPPNQMSANVYVRDQVGAQNDVDLLGEVLNMGVSCVAGVLGWLVVSGSSAAIPATAGASTIVSVVTTTAAIATTAQCIIGVERTRLAYFNPAKLEELDNEEWYQRTAIALDAISLVGVAASAHSVVRSCLAAKRATGKPIKSILKGLSRAERKRLAQEIARIQNNNASAKVIKDLMKTGAFPKRFSNERVNKTIALNLKDACAASLSASGSILSGNLNSLAVGMYEALG